MACQLCLDLLPDLDMETFFDKYMDINTGTDVVRFRFSWLDLCTSANFGCVICSTIKDGISHLSTRLPGSTCKPTSQWKLILNFKPLETSDPAMWINVCGLDKSEDWTMIKFISQEGESRPWRVLPYSIVGSDTSSPQSLCKAITWLDKCTAEHTRCRIFADSPLPTRVIDVGGPISPDLRLYETKNEHAEYLTLSHRWGEMQPLITTKATLSRRKEKISLSSLPQTFRDAVLFTRRLKKRYLWIDSLCIIQDSADDWRRESANMAGIYQGSWLNLAALKAYNCNQGFFSSTVQLNPTVNGQRYRIFAQVAKSHLSGAKGESSGVYPITRRAWIYQERLLSPRVLHFGQNELLWECQEVSTCECSEKNPSTVEDQESHLESFKIAHSKTLVPKATIEELQARWYDIVQEYSALGLTKASDKLPAIAGVAKQMYSFRQSDCVAGMWTDTLLDDLMWFVYHPEKRNTDVAPSWSWASRTGRVKFVRGFTVKGEADCDVSVAEIIDEKHDEAIKVTKIGSLFNKFSRRSRRPSSVTQDNHPISDFFSLATVNRYSLVAFGQVVPATEMVNVKELLGEHYWSTPSTWHHSIGVPPGSGDVNYAVQIGTFDPICFHRDTATYPEDLTPNTTSFFRVEPESGIYCLKLTTKELNGCLVHDILVIKAVDEKKRTYRRIGLAKLATIKTHEDSPFFGVDPTAITLV